MISSRSRFDHAKRLIMFGALALGWGSISVARGEAPGRLVWNANFNDGQLPQGMQVVSKGREPSFVVDPHPGQGDGGQVLTSENQRLVDLALPVKRPNFRIEWRGYGNFDDPSQCPRVLISGAGWSADFRANPMWLSFFTFAEDMQAQQDNTEREDVTSVKVNDMVLIESDQSAWHTYAVEKVGRNIFLEFDGKRTKCLGVLPAVANDDATISVNFKVPAGGLLDDVKVYDLSGRLAAEPGDLRVGYYPSLHKLVAMVFANDPAMTRGRITLEDAAGKQLAEQEVALQTGQGIGRESWDPQAAIVDVPNLPNGKYLVRSWLSDATGKWRKAGSQHIVREHFAWETEKVGVTEEVLPPFTPIEVDGRNVDVVLRKYKLTGLGLIEQVEADGQDEDEVHKPILAGPVTLHANGKALEGQGKFVSQAPNRVVYEGQADADGVSVALRNTIEEDGCMKIELTLAPAPAPAPGSSGGPGNDTARLKSLTLDIPIKDEMAPLWHLVTRRLRINPAGATPAGTGVVWDGATGWPNTEYVGNFKPYFWFGAESRGLCWFADNDKGWELDLENNVSCQQVIREDGVLTLRVNMVQKPVVFTAASEPRTITFGLMATPTKPMPEGWRAIGRKDKGNISFSMPMLFGMPTRYASKAPISNEFSPFDFILGNRLGQRNDKKERDKAIEEFIEDWSRRYLETRPEMGPKAIEGFKRTLAQGLGRFANTKPGTMVSIYFDEMHATGIYHKEVPTFFCEWNQSPWMPMEGSGRHSTIWGEPGKDWMYHPSWGRNWGLSTSKLAPSYQDFALWYGREWVKRGVGLYFDNTFPRYVYDPLLSDSYFLPDGRQQPAGGIWAHRDYFRRIWTLHVQNRREDAPQVMMLHMTNTHVAPYMGWNDANLDLEWKMRVAKLFQEKFSPDLLRAEAIGLQTGNIPLAIGSIHKNSVGKEWYQANGENYNRAKTLGYMVHEIKEGIGSSRLPEPVEAFGYGLPECKVVNYWDDNVPLNASDDACKWLLLRNNDELMVVLCTWNPEDSDVTLTFDSGALGLSLREAVDAETGEALAVTDNSVTVPVVGYGGRIIKIK